MKILFAKILFPLLLGALCFAAGMAYAWWSHSNNYPVTVSISNQSNQELKSLVLSHNGMGLKGVLDIEPPDIGGSKTVRFSQPGEGSFNIEATLNNGKVLKGSGSYVEAGYTVQLVITSTEIRSKYAL